ncbi:MAG: NAD(P)H-hydrate dehydratase [Gammaproteobacteria bacterium]|nr:NAD(P)H-hydrate dehydratase [Gammaproteobacteria bacterium]
MEQTLSSSRLYTVAQSRELDRIAIRDFGIDGLELMERAGHALFERLQAAWPRVRRIMVLCGAGNNGGDGYVLGRLARAAGIDVNLHALCGSCREGSEAAAARARYLQDYAEISGLPTRVSDADVIVDALFGTGIDRPLSDEFQRLFERINNAAVPVLAADVPSGLNAETGRVMGAALSADHTVSFISLKQGLFTGVARDVTGVVELADLGLPDGVYQQIQPAGELLDWPSLRAVHLRPRRRCGHKGDYGHLLVIGGDAGMQGAVRLAGEAALRSGAGLVSVATHPAHAAQVNASRPELMAQSVARSEALQPLFARATALVMGPGLGQGVWGSDLLQVVLERPEPKVLDADALNLLAREPVYRDNWILTPHPGEAARLLDSDTAEVEGDRFAAAREIVARYGGVCLLKGAGSLIVSKDEVTVCPYGNPGMASGGMGDVLSGLVGGLLAQGLTLMNAAKTATALHARAGDRAAVDGERGLIASDLFPAVRALINGMADASD